MFKFKHTKTNRENCCGCYFIKDDFFCTISEPLFRKRVVTPSPETDWVWYNVACGFKAKNKKDIIIMRKKFQKAVEKKRGEYE